MMESKNPANIVTDYMCLPISRTEAKEEISKLQKHLEFTPEELHEHFLKMLKQHHPEVYKSWDERGDLPEVERFK